MLKSLVRRIIEAARPLSMGGKPRAPKKNVPKMVAAAEHGIALEALSRGSMNTVKALQDAGFQAFIVGGAVRDLLLGLKPKDFDVATNATPDQVLKCFRRSRAIGKRFKIIHVYQGSETIEVSTFRAPSDEAALTDSEGRVLRDNVFGNQEQDAARRDFTVNAMFFDPVANVVIDYHKGMADLKAKTLRMIGDPATRYREDPVRMLRVARFAAKLQFKIEPKTKAPIEELGALLSNVPPSRLFDEMLKMLLSGYAVAAVKALRDEKLHHGLLPLLDVILEQPQGEKFLMLALQRTDERIGIGKGVSPGFLFSALLWNEVLKVWQQRKAANQHAIPALFAAMDDVIDQQSEKLAITKRHVGDMKEIWALQPRFERRNGRFAHRLMEHPRFRAAYDFLLLRGESGEIDAALGTWWTEFIDADDAGRNALVNGLSARDGQAPAKKRRRVRSRRPEGENGGDTGPENAVENGSGGSSSGMSSPTPAAP